MTQDIACPVCGSELTLAQLFADEDTRRAFSRLASVSIPLGSRVLQYATLFAPAKTRLTVPKQIKIILILLPDLERLAITHRGRDWAVPLNVWAQAIDQMLVARDMNKLDLPMKGHGYLYSILVGLADKVEANAETEYEAQRRGPPAATFQQRGQVMPMALQALGGVLARYDPALAKLDADAKTVAPMPQAARDQLAALKRNKPV
jgi:hypothetical protein